MSAALSSALLRVLQIIWLDLLLSGDNAIVIALACRDLPLRQRRRAAALGAIGAILLRIFFAAALLWLLRLPFLRIAGAVFLVGIAIRLVEKREVERWGEPSRASLWAAVRVIILADALMSLDNVLAITAAAGGDPWLVAFGLCFSLPVVVLGAALFERLLEGAPWLLWASAVMIGWSAGQMAAADPAIAHAKLLADLPSMPPLDVQFAGLGAALVLAIAGLRSLLRGARQKRRSGAGDPDSK